MKVTKTTGNKLGNKVEEWEIDFSGLLLGMLLLFFVLIPTSIYLLVEALSEVK